MVWSFSNCFRSNVETARALWRSIDIRLGKKPPKDKDNRCGGVVPHLMLFSMTVAKVPVPSSSFASTIFCCFLSLLVWTVAVVSLHHLGNVSTGHSIPTATFVDGAEEFLEGAPPPPPFVVDSSFRWDWSTEDNYQATTDEREQIICEGRFADIRRDLIDYNFHKLYTCQRQEFQDRLIDTMLGSIPEPVVQLSTTTTTTTEQDQACPVHPRRNWIVFTAGVM